MIRAAILLALIVAAMLMVMARRRVSPLGTSYGHLPIPPSPPPNPAPIGTEYGPIHDPYLESLATPRLTPWVQPPTTTPPRRHFGI